MEVLLISHKFPPSVGGMQKQSFELVEGLRKRLRIRTIIFRSGYPKIFFVMLAWFRAWISCLTNPDIKIIHANDGLMAFFISPLLFLTDKKFAVTIHGLDVVFPLGLYQRWVRTVLSRFDLIITVSEETRNECIKRGISPEKVFYVSNGFEPATEKGHMTLTDLARAIHVDLTEKKLILSVGRPVTRKGFSWFILNVLPYLNNDCLYIISGPREKNKGLITLLQRLPGDLYEKLVLFLGLGVDEMVIDRALTDPGLQGKVLYLGKTRFEILQALRYHALIFTMPNLPVDGDFEGFGLVALEAAATGTLCVAASVDGIPSAIKDSKNGILLPAGATEAWISTLNTLLQDPDKTRDLGKTFQKNLGKNSFTWNTMCEGYAELFRKVTNS